MCFCRGSIENLDPLFFSCVYNKSLWQVVMKRNSYGSIPSSWQEMVYLGLKEWNNNGLKANPCKISWGVLVYNLWWQRNIIRNGSPPRAEGKLLQDVIWEVKCRIKGKVKLKLKPENATLCHLWGLSLDVLV